MVICFVCNKSACDATIKKHGVQSLLSASILRGDTENEIMLRSVENITMHSACYKKYADKREAELFKRRQQKYDAFLSTSIPSIPIEEEVSSSFNFKSYCLFCEQSVEAETKSPLYRRRQVFAVKSNQFRDSVLNYLNERQDVFSFEVKNRIENEFDLVAAEARYHQDCWSAVKKFKAEGFLGRPVSSKIDVAMNYVYNHIQKNAEECQFTLKELQETVEGDISPCNKTMKQRLQNKFGEEILIFDRKGSDTIVCFRDTGHKLLTQAWYNAKKTDPKEERLRVIREAAAIIVEDIRSRPYETKSYPPCDNFMSNVEESIPTSLNVLLSEIICKNKRGSLETWKRKCSSIGHAIISAVRPRSFISTIKIGVGTLLYKKFGSKNLISVLSSLGFCSSYDEISMFEAASIMRPEPPIKTSAFTQFVYDNADFNINTLDGHDTFHCMGGIQCITPFDAIEPDKSMNRTPEKRSSAALAEIANIELISYSREKMSGLAKLKVLETQIMTNPFENYLPTIGDFMWLYGKWACLTGIPVWNGFMEEATANKSYEKSKIMFLPFINAPPSNYDTIYTTLSSALTRSKAAKSQSCIITFDQPLFWKARDIVASADPSSDIGSIIVRLGGFHLIISFLGAIGYIMSGSGLEDALKVIYAENSVEKIISGHAYSRAIRAHFMVHLSLAKRIMDSIDFSDTERNEVDKFLSDLDRSLMFSAKENNIVMGVITKFDVMLKATENKGPTAKLWTQYFYMVTLLKHFIEAERSGNWKLHCETIQKMLPFFHASGHFLYAKSAHLYLQDMMNLRNKMSAEDFEKFTTQGYFTIRRTNKFWSGIMSDQTIEQTLNRESKISGGVFKRGVDMSVAARWTLGSVYMLNICEQVEDFCDIHSGTTEQHVDFRPSRVCRDNSDVEKLDQWFDMHEPFPSDSALISISRGITGTENINCHQSLEVGTLMLGKIIGLNYDSIKFKRKEKVLSLANVFSSIVVENVPVTINPLLLFQRMSISKRSTEDLQDCFAYELSPYPLSLFNEEGMRKGTKSSLYTSFVAIQSFVPVGNKRLDVIDGGFLLHKVVWPRTNATFETICRNYVSYVQRHFEKNVVVVFDGYPEDSETFVLKGWERRRRSAKYRSPKIVVNARAISSTTQDIFLRNDQNKSKLIDLLKKALQDADVTVQQAPGDADSFIVGTAIQEAANFDEVTVIGEDIDLLVLLTGLGGHLKNLFFKKPSRGQTQEQVFSSTSFKYNEVVAKHILFLHALSGCDTTSALFNVGKIKLLNILQKNQDLEQGLNLFREKNVCKESLVTSGERFLIALFGGSLEEKSLDTLRFKLFTRSVTKIHFNLATLPPTSAAAKQHVYRTYLQVQMWLENYLEPTEWGWKKTLRGLEPITTTADAAPQSLLKTISCKCKTTCGKMCGCRKAGLKCSVLCVNCGGETCDNVPEIRELLDNEDQIEYGHTAETLLSAEEILDVTEIEANDFDVASPSATKRFKF